MASACRRTCTRSPARSWSTWPCLSAAPLPPRRADMDQGDSLRELVSRADGARAPLRVVAVTGGKGGVGKTHVTCNLAVLAARAGRRVLVLDADLGLANADIVLGIAPHHHLGHVLDGSIPLEGALAEGPHG